MGTLFDRAYCQQPLCGPSRASVMSGLRPNTLNVWRLKDNLRRKLPNLVTMGEFFQKQGYYAGGVGKIYDFGNPGDIGTDGHDDPQTWNERFNPAGIDKTQEENIIRYLNRLEGWGKESGTNNQYVTWRCKSALEFRTLHKIQNISME